MIPCSNTVALLLTVLSASSIPEADERRVVYETQIDADIDAVWNAFTTKDGLQLWMAPLVELDLAVGGKMKSNYNASGKIGDETTIENTILSFDPKRMLSLKATGFPKGFPFEDAARKTWSIFYFTELPSSQTRITVVGLGYTDDEQSTQLRSFFAVANQRSLDKLKEALKQQDAATAALTAEQVDAAYAWAQAKLKECRRSFPPGMRGSGLPLPRPLLAFSLYNVSVTDAELGHLAAFPRLRKLDVRGKEITHTGLQPVWRLKQLQKLGLHGAQITDDDMRQLAQLRKLKAVDLSGARFTDSGISELAALPELRELALERTEVTEETLRQLSTVGQLQKLSLRKTSTGDDGLRHLAMLPELQSINLQSTKVTGKGLRHLAACKSLRAIHCWGTDVTAEDIRHMQELLPMCKIDKTLIE